MNLKHPPSISRIFSYFFTGAAAGLVGAAVFGIVILLSWSIVGDVLSPADIARNEFGVIIQKTDTHPLFLHFITLAIFLGILSASSTLGLLATVISERIKFRATIVTHIFFGNMVLFLLMLPGYIMFSDLFGSKGIAFAAILHGSLVTIFSYFTIQTVHITKHILVHLYGLLIGLLIFTWVIAILMQSNSALIAFLGLPLLMGLVMAGGKIAESIYGWIYQTYGTDYLNTDTRFGDDYTEK